MLLAALLVALVASPATAAKSTWMPGPARALPRTESASRDALVLEYAYGPRAQGSIGAEFGFLRLTTRNVSVWLGLHAMVALENAEGEAAFPPAELWRGVVGISSTLSFDRPAQRWLGPGGGLEVGLALTHESDHGDLDEERPARGLQNGGGGDWVTPDIAVRIPLVKALRLTLRLQDRVYVRGDLVHAPGGDVILRWAASKPAHVALALFGEGLIARGDARNGYFARGMLGLVLPGAIGEVTIFGSIDAGNGKGLLVNRRELRFSAGIRYAPFQ